MEESIRRIVKKHIPQPFGQQRKYAVLLPIIKIDNQLHILYEVRSNKISQPGETSFPGGHVEHGETYLEAALRETQEELNIPASTITIWGEINYIVTEWAIIHCFVGRLPDISLNEIDYNKSEVDRIFTIPIDYLINHPPIQRTLLSKTQWDDDFPFELITDDKDYQFRHARHPIRMYQLNKERLWGITANLTSHFIQLIDSNHHI